VRVSVSLPELHQGNVMQVHAILYFYEHRHWYSGVEGTDTILVFIVLVSYRQGTVPVSYPSGGILICCGRGTSQPLHLGMPRDDDVCTTTTITWALEF